MKKQHALLLIIAIVVILAAIWSYVLLAAPARESPPIALYRLARACAPSVFLARPGGSFVRSSSEGSKVSCGSQCVQDVLRSGN